ncbi:sensor histidine kinase [Micromonospora sagamiensis]|uniref:Anti-sigma regulatory factor (Ser/Thr protein kinase) n=1 Tax=Micromonospora sagamiensis TaxID=47875 RepID=A0A562WJE7_9ACTN|nr:sensor histidine kinase [Micromonospora sagamiensis]TWJ29654.1 anti-sigma regulatory factor (Ser/Thr protein kinase) [Micromonospora sagamiensis]BCL17314.1 anti-sigma regulatory factor [Micromonospora sagamiensis]
MTEPAALTHDAMFYDTDDEFVTRLLPFIHEGLAQGQAVTAAVTTANITLLRDALGHDATAVSFIDRDGWYQRPASTVAGWRRLLTEASGRGHRRVRMIGEVAFGAQERHTTWTRYEAALNELFADAPAWIVCPYDSRTLPATVLTDARRTHPAVFDPVRRDSDTYLPPRRFLTAVPEPMPSVTGPPALTMVLHDTMAPARHAVRQLLEASAHPARLDDLMIVLSEIVANGLRHGRGHRELRLWWHAPTVTCEVSDAGPGPADPLLGYLPPPSGVGVGGRGLWIAQQLCDALAIGCRDGENRVRFAIDLRRADASPRSVTPAEHSQART